MKFALGENLALAAGIGGRRVCLKVLSALKELTVIPNF